MQRICNKMLKTREKEELRVIGKDKYREETLKYFKVSSLYLSGLFK